MMKCTLADVADITMGQSPKSEYYNSKGDGIPFLQGNRTFGQRYPIFDTYTTFTTKIAKAGDVIMSVRAPVGDLNITPVDMCLGRGVCGIRMKNGNNNFLFYLLKYYMPQLINKETGTVFGSVNRNDINKLEINIPKEVDIQKKISTILSLIDDKIEENEKINKNLEQQAQAIFIEQFADNIFNSTTNNFPSLGDLVKIIDNRGKTPPLTTKTFKYPIIDVGALKGRNRIVDFNNCTKYVDDTTYNTWFRSGHPKPWDILLSTVGSLAEMKVYLGTKGCIAQNVIAIRSISVSPLYLYQYLKFIRNDLVAYNIGSVQPSIKVTHIIKHPIFLPTKKKLDNFDKIARIITKQIFTNYSENELLISMRDTLLKKLMSGEIDVSNIDL